MGLWQPSWLTPQSKALCPRGRKPGIYLVAFEEGRDFEGGPNVLQPVPVGDLGTENKPGF